MAIMGGLSAAQPANGPEGVGWLAGEYAARALCSRGAQRREHRAMSEAQAAHSRERRFHCIDLALSVRFRLRQDMFSGRCAPENAASHQRARSLPAWRTSLVSRRPSGIIALIVCYPYQLSF